MGTAGIRNHRRAGALVATGGQPTEAQLRAAAEEEGFRAVVNLAPTDPHDPLGDEAALVRSLGMEYHHVPVEWDDPRASDFAAFERVMQALPAGGVLIHCAANYRVSAFYSLYAEKHLGWSEQEAAAFRASVWQGREHPAWEAVLREIRAGMAD